MWKSQQELLPGRYYNNNSKYAIKEITLQFSPKFVSHVELVWVLPT